MFSGIVEGQTRILSLETQENVSKLIIERPFIFDDVSLGDSISVNGTCLTVESISPEQIEFTIGPETLHLTTWGNDLQSKKPVNVERSLRLGDRMHGHMVLGHVDGVAQVKESLRQGESLILKVQAPTETVPYIWKKGSVTLNGVSLTVNKIEGDQIEVCLIPETLRRTNLPTLQTGDYVNIEVDCMARALINFKRQSPGGLDGVDFE
ncbi:MAG: riboflavin synthase [Bdellovibrionales bacterium]